MEREEVLELIKQERELREQYQRALRLITETEKESINQRLHEMNNLRQQIEKERGSYLSRELYDREHKNLVDKVDAISLDQVGGKAQLWFMGAIITAIVSAISVAGEVILRLAWPGK